MLHGRGGRSPVDDVSPHGHAREHDASGRERAPFRVVRRGHVRFDGGPVHVGLAQREVIRLVERAREFEPHAAGFLSRRGGISEHDVEKLIYTRGIDFENYSDGDHGRHSGGFSTSCNRLPAYYQPAKKPNAVTNMKLHPVLLSVLLATGVSVASAQEKKPDASPAKPAATLATTPPVKPVAAPLPTTATPATKPDAKPAATTPPPAKPDAKPAAAKPASSPAKPTAAPATPAKPEPKAAAAKPATTPEKPATPKPAPAKPDAKATAAKPTPPPPPKPVSIFPDKALEEAVRKQVFAKRENKEPITAEDVANIAILEGKNMGIKDLTGLEKCAQLASITLPGNQITNLKAITGLERLQFLDVSKNQIEDISPLATCKALQYVELTGNKVKDVSALGGITALTSLYLAGNQIKDASPLFKLPKVWTLYLEGNPVTSIAGIGSMKWLSMLSLKGCGITDIAPLEPLASLQFIFLENNKIADFAPLHRMWKKDNDGAKEWAPYCQIFVEGNPVSDASKKLLDEMKAASARLKP